MFGKYSEWSHGKGVGRKLERDELRQQFVSYVERMKKVRLLSTPSLQDIHMADDYSRLLLSNFKKIGEYAGENREMLDEILFPLLHKEKLLTEEETAGLNELNQLLADGAQATEIDIHLSELISDFLTREEEKRFAMQKNDISGMEERISLLERRLDILYARLFYTGRSNQKEWKKLLEESVTAYEEACSYLEKKIFASLSEGARVSTIMLAINGTSMYNTRPNARGNENLEFASKQKELLERVSELLTDPFYEELLPKEYVLKARLYITSYIAAFGLLRGLSPELYADAYSCAMRLEREWAECPNLDEREIYFITIQELRLYCAYHTKSPQLQRCLEKVVEIYEKRDVTDYSYKGIDPNLSIAQALFFVLGSLKENNPGGLTERMEELLYSIPLNIMGYLFKAPKRENLGKYVNSLAGLLDSFVELPGGIHVHRFCVHTMAAMHPPTYIHSNMVAKISVCLGRHLLSLKPEVFCGFPGCETVEKVLENQKKILDYTWYSALYHDIGKLYVIDTIAMYGRRLLPSEFELIRSHPEKGAELAGRFASTRDYVDVIRGHHLWYDGSRGYPEDFDVLRSPYKAIIDIVSVADCLDAATDGVGRSYRAGKTVEDFQKELAEGAGTRYAPHMKEVFEDPATHADLVYLLKNGRKKLYKETYFLLKDLLQK